MNNQIRLLFAVVILFWSCEDQELANPVPLEVQVKLDNDGQTVLLNWDGQKSKSAYTLILGSDTLAKGFSETRFSVNLGFNYFGRGKLIDKRGRRETTFTVKTAIAPGTPTSTLIPDKHFEKHLIRLGIDTDGQINGRINTADALMVDTLRVFEIGVNYRDYTIKTLTGIEAFKNLVYLDCSGHDMLELDLSHNTKLEYLFCGGPVVGHVGTNDFFLPLHKLSIGTNTRLKLLSIPFTRSYFIDHLIRNQKDLEVLNARWCRLADIDLATNTKLKELYLNGNYQLYSLKYLDLSKNKALEICQIDVNFVYLCLHSLTGIDFNKKVTKLIPDGGGITGNVNKEIVGVAWEKDVGTEYRICQ